jgi:hypothetical protein
LYGDDYGHPSAEPPTAVISGGAVIETFVRQVILSGEESVNPTGGALTYTWDPRSTRAPRFWIRVSLGPAYNSAAWLVTIRSS